MEFGHYPVLVRQIVIQLIVDVGVSHYLEGLGV